MKNFQTQTRTNLKTKMFGIALMSILAPIGLAQANDKDYRRPVSVTATSGHVEVVHKVPGGVISVGVEFGRRPPVVVENRREVVVVERPRREVVVVERPHREVVVVERPRHCPREVTVIREIPRREVTVIKTIKHGRHGKKVTVIEKHTTRGHDWDRKEHRNKFSVREYRSEENRNIYAHR